jgi:hypothetical protein
MTSLAQRVARIATGLVVAGVLVGGAAPAFADEPTPPAKNTLVAGSFDVTGSNATAVNIVTDRPGTTTNDYDLALPFHRGFSAPADTDLLQVVVTGEGRVSCSITFGGRVVAQESGDSTAHCIYSK